MRQIVVCPEVSSLWGIVSIASGESSALIPTDDNLRPTNNTELRYIVCFSIINSIGDKLCDRKQSTRLWSLGNNADRTFFAAVLDESFFVTVHPIWLHRTFRGSSPLLRGCSRNATDRRRQRQRPRRLYSPTVGTEMSTGRISSIHESCPGRLETNRSIRIDGGLSRPTGRVAWSPSLDEEWRVFRGRPERATSQRTGNNHLVLLQLSADIHSKTGADQMLLSNRFQSPVGL